MEKSNIERTLTEFKIQNFSFVILLALLTSKGFAQTSMDTALANIAKNNKTIVANTKYWEAKKLEYQSGLTPYNPKVDYDYMIGNPSNAGNQTDFTITQSFDFPTVYAKRKQLSNEQIKQAEIQLLAIRREVLLEAKLICIELIYRRKLQSELSIRKQNAEKWLSAFQTSVEKGQGNIMDLNKAKLQLIEIKAAFQENISTTNQLIHKLTELNGGLPIEFADTAYASIDLIPNFEALLQEIRSNDPMWKYLEQEKVIGEQEISLSKSLNLPKIETGYHYQAILGQRFNGLHVGLTIPLWENKNKVKTQQAELFLNEATLHNHVLEQHYEVKQKYEQMTNLKITLDEYHTLFESLNSLDLLDKSLSLGQISTIEYFMELTYYYDALKNFLKIEMEYYMVVSELYKYQL